MQIPFTTWAETRARFKWELPAHFNYGRDVVDAFAAATPDKLCLIAGNDAGEERRFTWGEMRRLTNRLASALRAGGIKPGDRVVVMLPRIPEWQIASIACTKAGAVIVPCIEMLTAKDVDYRIRHSGAVAAMTTRAAAPKFAGHEGMRLRIAVGGAPGWQDFDTVLGGQPDTFACHNTGIEDPAIIYYTSGSTGLPKGVTHAARGLYVWRVSGWFWQEFSPDDLVWCTADTGWSKSGTSVLWCPWACGSAVYIHDGKFDPAGRLERIERLGVTLFCGAATEFRHIVNIHLRKYNLSRLRLCVSAGEMVNPDIIRRWEEATGVRLIEAYGQTETLMTVANHAREGYRPGSMGRAVPGTDVAIIDEAGRTLPADTVGEIAIRLPNPNLMIGYWNEPERTAKTRVTHGGVEWFKTGDLGRMDADGYCTYEGRTDDIISSAGYRIGPQEVENALIEHPAVLECAAVAAPDIERGEIVKAFIVLRAGHVASEDLARDIQEHVKRTTAPYKYPRAVAFVAELPKTATGKVLRRELKRQEFDKAGKP